MMSPLRFWLSAWAVLLGLTLYGAREVRALVLETSWLTEQEWAVDGSAALVEWANALRLTAAAEQLDAWIERIDPLRGAGGEAGEAGELGDGGEAGEPNLGGDAPNGEEPPSEDPAGEEPTGEGKGGGAQMSASDRNASAAIRDALGHGAAAQGSLRVLLMGASSMQYALGIEFERLFKTMPHVTVVRSAKAATGLTRDDVLDWNARAEALITEFSPALVVAQFGGNDAQGMMVKDKATGKQKVYPYASADWDAEYSDRVARIVKFGSEHGAQVVMLGMPIMRQPSFSTKMAHVNELTKVATEQHGGMYLSTWELAADERGNYRASVTFAGRTGQMRMSDGHHFSTLGGMFAAAQLTEQMQTLGVLPPAAGTP